MTSTSSNLEDTATLWYKKLSTHSIWFGLSAIIVGFFALSTGVLYTTDNLWVLGIFAIVLGIVHTCTGKKLGVWKYNRPMARLLNHIHKGFFSVALAAFAVMGLNGQLPDEESVDFTVIMGFILSSVALAYPYFLCTYTLDILDELPEAQVKDQL